MKPIELELRWFGQYTHAQVVRFDSLERVFLITGETGAGKTTLFDAISFALYGKGLGKRAQGFALRSQLAGEEDSTMVRFRFSVRGEVWEVVRSPYNFVRRRRTGTVESSEYVTLTRFPSTGGSVSTKPEEAEARLRSLVGLKHEDFSKILVLPQGEFQAFLSMDSSQRAVLLKTLFPVRGHTEIAELAKKRVQTIVDALKETEARLAEAKVGIDLSRVAEESERLAHEAAQARKRAAQAEAAREAAAKLLAGGQELDGLLKRLATEEGRLALHEASRPEQQMRIARRDLAQKAANVLPTVAAAEALRAEIARLLGLVEAANTAVVRCDGEMERLRPAVESIPAREAALKAARAEGEVIARRIAVLDAYKVALDAESRLAAKAAAAEAEVAVAVDAASMAHSGLAALDLAQQAREALRAELEGARDAVNACEKLRSDAECVQRWCAVERPERERRRAGEQARLDRLVHDSVAAEAALVLARERVESDAALVVAAGLVAGEPCAACGSREHPEPRTGEPGEGDVRAALAQAHGRLGEARAAVDTASRLLHALDEGTAAKREIAEIAERNLTAAGFADVGVWSAALEAARGALKPLADRDASLGLQIADRPRRVQAKALADATLASRQAGLAAAERDLAEARGVVGAHLAELGAPPTDLDAAVRAARVEWQAGQAAVCDEERAVELLRGGWTAASAAAEGARASRRTLHEQLSANEARRPELEEREQAALRRSGFTDAGEARGAALADAALRVLEKEIVDWDNAVSAHAAAILTLGTQVAGRPSPDLPALASAASDTSDMAKATVEAQHKAEHARDEYHRRLLRIDQLQEEHDRTLAGSRAMLVLSRQLNGEMVPRVDFATWMLTWWLERVLASGNLRLRTLSAGRYQFRLRAESTDGRKRGGLDLEVLDTWSNKLRDVNILSGGEKFLASLALALGLADVVQSLNGGVQLDTLFIDEGFGSLDGATLEDAMRLIHEISASRAVGLISHVEAMQKEIASQIRVTKSPTGSRAVVV